MRYYNLSLTNLEGTQLAFAGFEAPDDEHAVAFVIAIMKPSLESSGLKPETGPDGMLRFRPQFTGEVLPE